VCVREREREMGSNIGSDVDFTSLHCVVLFRPSCLLQHTIPDHLATFDHNNAYS